MDEHAVHLLLPDGTEVKVDARYDGEVAGGVHQWTLQKLAGVEVTVGMAMRVRLSGARQ
jgi:hypothetical protein